MFAYSTNVHESKGINISISVSFWLSFGCEGVTLPPTETIEEFAGQLHPFLQGNDDTKESRLV